MLEGGERKLGPKKEKETEQNPLVPSLGNGGKRKSTRKKMIHKVLKGNRM